MQTNRRLLENFPASIRILEGYKARGFGLLPPLPARPPFMARLPLYAVAVIYAAFIYFYGGGPITDPLPLVEFNELLTDSGLTGAEIEEMAGKFYDDSGVERGGSFVMLNFVNVRRLPDYGDRPDLQPEWVTTGQQADNHYGILFLSKLLPRAGHLVAFSPSLLPAVIAPAKTSPETMLLPWDYFAAVRYRSLRSFLRTFRP
jgi:hypothetical protein